MSNTREASSQREVSGQSATAGQAGEAIEVDLRNPLAAGLLAWIFPGAGHMYQRRYAKGVLFMLCILGTFLVGLLLADGRVVYASMTREDFRWQYFCQLGVGAPALPALLQNYRVRRDMEPLLRGVMAPPRQVMPNIDSYERFRADELSNLHLKYHSRFELGTLYTMIAGLLNVLAIYDAAAGPVIYVSSGGGGGGGKDPSDPKDGT